MPLSALAKYFQQHLFPLPSSEVLLNPYSYAHPDTDQTGAAVSRQTNLLNYLSHFQEKPRILIVGEAPGPWGCRFSGVPFTSERQLANGELPFPGRPTSTLNPPAAERSATIFWETLKLHHDQFLVWNSLPLLPHAPNDPTRLRPPKKSELIEYQHILETVISLLQPEVLLAVGRRAQQALKLLNRPCQYLRHPSHGGKSEFLKVLIEF
jgi:uracil-DNA glycosylase